MLLCGHILFVSRCDSLAFGAPTYYYIRRGWMVSYFEAAVSYQGYHVCFVVGLCWGRR